MNKLTLESVYRKAKADYAKRGYDENSWQWNDEGKIYAILDYLSMMGEMSDDDWEFAKREGIEDDCGEAIEMQEEN